MDLLISHPDDVIRPPIVSPFARFLFPHILYPPNHVDKIPKPLSLRYNVTSIRSLLALSSPISPSVPPHVAETLHGFCLRIMSSIHTILVDHIVPFIEFFYTAFPRSRQVPCGRPYVQSYKILDAPVIQSPSLNLDIGSPTPLFPFHVPSPSSLNPCWRSRGDTARNNASLSSSMP